MGHLVAGDRSRRPARGERRLLRLADVAGDLQRWAARSVGRSIQWSTSLDGHHERVAGRERGDREEGHARVVAPHEPARDLAVDDAGEDASAIGRS